MERGGHPVLDGARVVRRDKGVRLAIEACGSQLVYNVSTMQRLIDAAGADVVGANLDPSHLMWMGADIPTVIRALGSSIFHVHAKDIRVQRPNADRDGLLDTLPIERAGERSWNYVTLGLGHPQGATFWADFVYTLRSVGYDGTLEHRARGHAGQLGRGCQPCRHSAQAGRPGRAARLEAGSHLTRRRGALPPVV